MARKPKITEFKNPTPDYDAEAEHSVNAIGRRITEIRSALGYSQRDLSILFKKYGIDMSPQGIGHWERGLTVPSAYQIIAVCRALDIRNMDELRSDPPLPQLNEAGVRKLREYEKDLIASGNYKPEPRCGAIRFRSMPVSTLKVSAGCGIFLDEGSTEMMDFPENTIPDKADFAVQVSGDSMEPAFRDGQYVWVQKCSRLRPGEIGVFVYDGEGYIKAYNEQEPEDKEAYTDLNGVLHMQPVLISYNRKYAPRIISREAEFSIIGRVLV